jgi:endo-1,4-beta-D-glucanase Y
MRKLFILLLLQCTFLASHAQTLQAESMTVGGPFAGKITSPFGGVAYYGNGDKSDGSITLTNATGVYNVTVNGASTNTSAAQIDLLIDGVKVGTFSFSGTTSSASLKSLQIATGTTNKAIQLLLSTDTGGNDTYVDNVVFAYQGALPPPRTAPTVPSASTFSSGVYRNMFVESGQTAAAVTAKMDQMWNQFFVNGTTDQKLFYPVGTDMAYILDTGNGDIRSEGMSYGMMICVQLNKKAEFDKLWKFAKTYSQHPAGNARAGLFAWQLNATAPYGAKDANSAPDGEEYFATALFFANARWGSTGTFNYKADANYILDNMLNKAATTSGGCPTNLINTVENQVVFGICGSSASFTDPSYHLPAFYEIWAREATSNISTWANMAIKSRTVQWPGASNGTTGLMPDYSNFNGTARTDQGTHGNFEYDAWRCIMNMAVDQTWFKQSTTVVTPLINRQIDFFKNKPNYGALWTLDGLTNNSTSHSPGLVGCNAVGALALADAKVWPFIDDAFNTPIPSGQYRYYDGLLYMMSYMHLSGNFKIYLSGTTPSVPVTGVSMSPTSTSVAVGSTTQLTATVAPANATNKAVSWTSSNTSVATVNTSGLVSGVAAGTATITVTTSDGNKIATSVITVTSTTTNVAVTGVTMSPTSASVVAGSTTQLSATVAPSNATNKAVTWTSSNTAIATVNSSGLVTGVAAGTATITVKTTDGNKIATSAITVTAATTSSFPGYYNIFARHSGKGLDVIGNASNSGAGIQQYDINSGGGSNQRWKFVASGSNYFIIVKSTQMCLAPSNLGTNNAELVQQRTCGTGNEFKWTVTSIGGGFYKITNVNSGKGLDIQNVSTANGALLQVYDIVGNGGTNQNWSFTQVETTARVGNKSGIEKSTEPNEDEIFLSPNPVNNLLKVKSKYLPNGTIELISISGKVAINQANNSENDEKTIDVSSIQQGIYLVKVMNEQGFSIKKLVKE